MAGEVDVEPRFSDYEFTYQLYTGTVDNKTNSLDLKVVKWNGEIETLLSKRRANTGLETKKLSRLLQEKGLTLSDIAYIRIDAMNESDAGRGSFCRTALKGCPVIWVGDDSGTVAEAVAIPGKSVTASGTAGVARTVELDIDDSYTDYYIKSTTVRAQRDGSYHRVSSTIDAHMMDGATVQLFTLSDTDMLITHHLDVLAKMKGINIEDISYLILTSYCDTDYGAGAYSTTTAYGVPNNT